MATGAAAPGKTASLCRHSRCQSAKCDCRNESALHHKLDPCCHCHGCRQTTQTPCQLGLAAGYGG